MYRAVFDVPFHIKLVQFKRLEQCRLLS